MIGEPDRVRLWRGDDPVVFGRIVAVLSEAGLPFEPETDFSHLSLFPDLHRPGYSIVVQANDYERAAKLVEKVLAEPAAE